MLLPGPEAQQLAVYMGWLMHRTWGGIIAGAFFVIPSIFILLILSYIYAAYGSLSTITGVLNGFKPVVIAIVLSALFSIGKKALKGPFHYAIALAAFLAIYLLHVPFPLIVVGAGLLGLIGMRYLPGYFSPGGESRPLPEGGAPTGSDRPVIDDDSPPPGHTLPSRRRLFRTILTGFLLWLLPLAVLLIWQRRASLYTDIYSFFSQSALVTFGGAYAVLAYVTQALTATPYNWLTPAQAIDGIALAETTPGPLIMFLQFIGFMAGWNHPVAGLSPAASAVLAALITTYATFLPSFVFIFAGAPYLEKLRGNRLLSGSLSAITSAVVGVILNLALVFGVAVILPGGTINWFAVVLTAVAFIALYFRKVDVMWVILAGGLAGLFGRLMGAL